MSPALEGIKRREGGPMVVPSDDFPRTVIYKSRWCRFAPLITPKIITRDPAVQGRVDQQTTSLKLYHYDACPFCVNVRRVIKRNSLKIEIGDVKRSDSAREELLAGRGNLMVPCLRIEDDQGGVRWMYESKDIVAYLERRFVLDDIPP